jgi:ferredoxin-NADP reductase
MMSSSARPLMWQQALVVDAIEETSSARTLVLDVPNWAMARPGQHVDVRLTAPDGYQATRSYSLSSSPGEPPQITVERVDDGEVSPFLVDVVEVGESFEVRGPVGGYFVWDPSPTPLLLIGGGSGIAPLRSMWRAAPKTAPVTVLYSAQTQDRVIYSEELKNLDGVQIHLTRETARGFRDGRIDSESLAAAVSSRTAQVFVCGPTAFVESVIGDLTPLIDDAHSIRAERFG